jgi:hypothetical protein
MVATSQLRTQLLVITSAANPCGLGSSCWLQESSLGGMQIHKPVTTALKAEHFGITTLQIFSIFPKPSRGFRRDVRASVLPDRRAITEAAAT